MARRRNDQPTQPPSKVPFQPDPGPLPAPPFAACPRCGRIVAVIVSLGYELFAHRTPMPESRLCDYPTRVKKSDVTFPASGPA